MALRGGWRRLRQLVPDAPNSAVSLRAPRTSARRGLPPKPHRSFFSRMSPDVALSTVNRRRGDPSRPKYRAAHVRMGISPHMAKPETR
ncbi:MAG: hypothetical protein Kow0092_16680 [Deferrisomatales bacterium]